MPSKSFTKTKSRADVDPNAAAIPFRSWCALHGISPATAYRLASAGDLKLVKLGRLTFIRREDSEQFFARLPSATFSTPAAAA
jgi:hypothetical protein